MRARVCMSGRLDRTKQDDLSTEKRDIRRKKELLSADNDSCIYGIPAHFSVFEEIPYILGKKIVYFFLGLFRPVPIDLWLKNIYIS